MTYFLKYMKIYEEDVDEDEFSAMFGFAAEFGYLNIVRKIMKNDKCDPAFEDNYTIRLAAQEGHLDVVKYLMGFNSKYGIDPAAQHNFAIRCAARGGHLDVVKYLMEEVYSKYDIDPAAQNNYSIQWSVHEGHLAVVRYLMEEVDSIYGIDPAAGDNHGIQIAAHEGHLAVVKYLMSLDSKYGIDRSLDRNGI